MEKSCNKLGNRSNSKRSLVFVAVVGLLAGGCHPPGGREPNYFMEPAGLNGPASSLAGAESATGETAYEQRISASLPTVAYVKYSASEGSSPSCALEIFEKGLMVARNEKMVECGLMSSPKMLSIEISGTASGLVVFQQKTKGTNSYLLRRNVDGDWVIAKVELVYPRDNLETGEIDVIRASADLAQVPVPVNRYSPDAITDRLVESMVQ